MMLQGPCVKDLHDTHKPDTTARSTRTETSRQAFSKQRKIQVQLGARSVSLARGPRANLAHYLSLYLHCEIPSLTGLPTITQRKPFAGDGGGGRGGVWLVGIHRKFKTEGSASC